MPLDHDSGIAELLSEGRHFGKNKIDTRVVGLLDLLAVDLADDLLPQIGAVGEEVNDDRVREDLFVFSPNG